MAFGPILRKFRHQIFILVCMLTHTDPTVMSRCPTFEKIGVFFAFVGYSCQLILVTSLMTGMLSYMLEFSQALAIGILIGVIIIVLEIRMLSSIWAPVGFLAVGQRDFSNIRLLLFRFLVAVCFAFVYGVTAEFYLQDDAIHQQLLNNQTIENQSLVEEYVAMKNEWRQEAKIQSQEITLHKKSLIPLINKQTTLSDAIFGLQSKEQREISMMKIEEEGLETSKEGKGKRYKTHENRARTYKELRLVKEQELNALNAKIDKIQNNIESLEAQWKGDTARWQNYDPEQAAAKDINYVPIKKDVLSRFLALDQIHRDPVNGDSAQMVSWLIKITIMLLELAPVIAKGMFSAPSAYPILNKNEIKRIIEEDRYDTLLQTNQQRMRANNIPPPEEVEIETVRQ